MSNLSQCAHSDSIYFLNLRSSNELNQPKSNQNENAERIKKSNRSMAPSILKRATFWEKKCEEAA